MRLTTYKLLLASSLILSLACALAYAQAGRRTSSATSERDVLLNVFAARADGSNNFVSAKDVSLFDGGVEQTVKSFSPDPGPARIVLLVDNSLSLRADVEKLSVAVKEFAYEIYEGDQLMVVGYDEQPEIVNDWTDDAKKIEAALPTLRKRGEPHLFDALSAVINEALRPFSASNRKRTIVLIGDGLDRGSKTTFKEILEELQAQDITLYSVQIQDRTGGAHRRDRPKPAQAIQQLTEGTGGRSFSIKEAHDAAKSICDELRKNRYILGYTPTSYGLTESRRLLLLAAEGIEIRTKTMIK
ncbi:MAG TPA: VWA domain-containing protein [Pyrinomonadaceae bacterium]|jgi:Ca-activated chloride channel family protein|nr:VWA domain-containing protein [Pyrinomonadaceae bacterium]